MDSESSTLLNVPITEEERRRFHQSRSSTSTQGSIKSFAQHARDRQFTPELGRFASLRQPGERYDDPEHDSKLGHSRSTTLPDIEEESQYSTHDDQEPIIRPQRQSTLPKAEAGGYQPVQTSQGQHHASELTSSHFWQPIWLRRRFLGLVMVLALLLIAALVVVGKRADANNGYPVPSRVLHYTWTWVPTFLFVLLAAVYQHIDFHSKLLTPWKELSLGPVNPTDSLLLDYLSQFQLSSFLAALKHLHRSVLVTTTMAAITKILTIAATALFIVQSRTFTHTVPSVINFSFGTAQLDEAVYNPGSFPNSSVYFYLENISHDLGPQLGFTKDFAYTQHVPDFSSSTAEDSTFTVLVDIFVPSISCRAANVTLNGQADIETTDFPYNSTERPYGTPANISLGINEPSLCSSWPELSFTGLDPLRQIVPERAIESKVQYLACTDNVDASPIVLLSITELAYTQELLTNVSRPAGGVLPIALTTSRSVTRMQHVLCHADYSLGKANLTNDTQIYGPAALSLQRLSQLDKVKLPGLAPENMTRLFNSLLNSNTGYFVTQSDAELIRSPGFDLLAYTYDGDYSKFFDADLLARTAQGVYMGTMPQFASQNLIQRSNQDDGPAASVVSARQRLLPNWTSMIVVIAGLAVLVILTIVLTGLAPRNVVPQDPRLIAAAATTLTRSPKLNRLLQKETTANHIRLPDELDGCEAGTAIAVDQVDGSRSFKIHVTEGPAKQQNFNLNADFKFWNTKWASFAVVILTFAMPLALIAVLEVLKHLSENHHGLFDVPDDRSTVIGSHYIPALVTLIVAATVGNLTFYITLFAPWSRMAASRATAKHSVSTNVFGSSLFTAIPKSIKAGYSGALSAVLATLLAGMLTIFVSGLFVVRDFDFPGPTQPFSPLDTFNLSLATKYTVDFDGGAGAMLDLTQNSFTFPPFTMGEYAFPALQLLEANEPLPPRSLFVGFMNVTLPAWRGHLDCDAPVGYELTNNGSQSHLSISHKVPESCLRAVGPELENATINLTTDLAQSNFAGKLFDLRFGTNSSQYGHLGEASSSLVGSNPAAGCPSLLFAWGTPVKGKDAMNVAICYQKLQAVTVNATMLRDTTNLNTGVPLIPDEKTARSLSNPNGTDTFDFRVQKNLARQLGSFSSSSSIDSFFAAMLANVETHDMLTSTRQTGLVAITHTYRLYMAQVINSLMRQDLTTQPRQDSVIPDAHTTIQRSRLVLDFPSKIILQVLLGLSSLLITTGYFLTKIRNILPVNPCSIAGTMSLLAGSDLCYSPDSGICECCGKRRQTHSLSINADDHEHAKERVQVIPAGIEWMSKEAFERVFSGKMYSLGWWENKAGRRYGVDYVEGEEWYLKRKVSETFDSWETTNERGRGNERGMYEEIRHGPDETLEMKDLHDQRRGRYADE